MRQFGLLLVAIALGAAAWWWFTSEMPRRERERAIAAEAAAEQAERADSLYRWRDAAGTRHEERTSDPVSFIRSRTEDGFTDLEVIRPSLEDVYLEMVA